MGFLQVRLSKQIEKGFMIFQNYMKGMKEGGHHDVLKVTYFPPLRCDKGRSAVSGSHLFRLVVVFFICIQNM